MNPLAHPPIDTDAVLAEAGIDIHIGTGAVKHLLPIMQRNGWQKILLVADVNTYAVAGKIALDLLQPYMDTPINTFVFPDKALVGEEYSVGRLLMGVEPGIECIVALGSGTLNDLVRYVSFRLHVPYVIVATAASMDGFASPMSPLNRNNLKITHPACLPYAIICDTEFTKTAPQAMTAAGLGDMAGKYNSLCDWRLAGMLFGDKHSETVSALMTQAAEVCMDNPAGLAESGETALEGLARGLVLSGIAMKLAESTRPASGAEHHMSHFWEMMFIFQNKPAVLHGTKVGIGALTIKRLHMMLLADMEDGKIDWDAALAKADRIDPAAYEQTIRRIFGSAAELVLAENIRSGRSFGPATRERIQLYRERWPEIRNVLETAVPEYQRLENALRTVHGAISPKDIGVDRESYVNGLVYARELRQFFTMLVFLGDLGVLKGYAERLAKEIYG